MLNIDIDYHRCMRSTIQSWCHFLLKVCLLQNVKHITEKKNNKNFRSFKGSYYMS